MARRTKVDSAEKSGVERRAEDSSASSASEGATSGAYPAQTEPRTNAAARVASAGDDDVTPEGQHSARAAEGSTRTGLAPATGGRATRSELATGALAAEAFSANGFDDDEDVSLDELLISDSVDGDEEEEATDIHPGLSDVVLAESLRSPAAPAPLAVARALSVEE